MQTEKQRRLASNASSAPRNTRCTTALSSCLSSASSASCPTLPVDLTSKSPKCAPRPRKPEWPRPAPKRECPTRRRCVTRRDCATTAKQKAPRFRRDHEARELGNRRRQSNIQHDPRHIPSRSASEFWSQTRPSSIKFRRAVRSRLRGPSQRFCGPKPFGRRVNGGGVNRRGQVHFFAGGFTPPSYPGYTLFVCITVSHLQGRISWFRLSFVLVRVLC